MPPAKAFGSLMLIEAIKSAIDYFAERPAPGSFSLFEKPLNYIATGSLLPQPVPRFATRGRPTGFKSLIIEPLR
jgi:hypothetical protein